MLIPFTAFLISTTVDWCTLAVYPFDQPSILSTVGLTVWANLFLPSTSSLSWKNELRSCQNLAFIKPGKVPFQPCEWFVTSQNATYGLHWIERLKTWQCTFGLQSTFKRVKTISFADDKKNVYILRDYIYHNSYKCLVIKKFKLARLSNAFALH